MYEVSTGQSFDGSVVSGEGVGSLSPKWPIVFCKWLSAIATHSNIASLNRGDQVHYCIVRLKGFHSSLHMSLKWLIVFCK